jgi:16S rRNA (guanine(527)-N(7))-methyltransferase RsmG
MNNIEKMGEKALHAWNLFLYRENRLSATQKEQFEKYLLLLQEWNKKFNLTAIVDIEEILPYHFQDSMRLADFVAFKPGDIVCDVGSGAGFPGIPLKIMMPDIQVILLEVNQKKVGFLKMVIQELGLTDIEVCSMDWRTFLRQSPYDKIDYVCARASLQPEELVRMFKPSCVFNQADLIYWAAQQWEPIKGVDEFIVKREHYIVGRRNRQLIFLKNNV